MSMGALLRWRDAVTSADGPPSPTRRHVLLVMWWAITEGGRTTPSPREIAAWCGRTRRTVIRHLRIAESEGWVERIETAEGVRWSPMLGEGVVL